MTNAYREAKEQEIKLAKYSLAEVKFDRSVVQLNE
jgi:hypothetical protein